MKKYEYKREWYSTEIDDVTKRMGLMRTINDIAHDGWRLINIIKHGHGEYEMFFEREL